MADKQRKLYIEFRVNFHPDTNQELLHHIAKVAQEEIYDLFEGRVDETSGPMPSPLDVTFEVVLKVERLIDAPGSVGKSEQMQAHAERAGIPILTIEPTKVTMKEWMEKWTSANEEQAEARLNRKTHKCECPKDSTNHGPNACDSIAYNQYLTTRFNDGENLILWLCDSCRYNSDTQVE